MQMDVMEYTLVMIRPAMTPTVPTPGHVAIMEIALMEQWKAARVAIKVI